MKIYDRLVAALGEAYDSGPMADLLGQLSGRKSLKKDGGYRASLTFKPDGIYLIFDWRRPKWVSACAILFPPGVDGFGGFPEPIDGRLSIASTRTAVRQTFGTPSRSGGSGGLIAGVIKDRPWDRYDRQGHSLRFDYDDGAAAIHLVTLMSAACAQELNADLRAEPAEESRPTRACS